MKHYTPAQTKVQIKIVGFLDLKTYKRYSSKNEFVETNKANIKQTNKMSFAAILKGEALRVKFWAAKKLLLLRGYSWELYINVCNALRLVKQFNLLQPNYLRIKL